MNNETNRPQFSVIHAMHSMPATFTIHDYCYLVKPVQNSYLHYLDLSSTDSSPEMELLGSISIDASNDPLKNSSFLKIKHKVEVFHELASIKGQVVSLESNYKNIPDKIEETETLAGIMSLIKVGESAKDKNLPKSTENHRQMCKRNEQLLLVFYSLQNDAEHVLKLPSKLLNGTYRNQYKLKTDPGNQLIIVLISQYESNSQKYPTVHQIIVIDIKMRIIRTSGFVEGCVCSIEMGPLSSFTVLFDSEKESDKCQRLVEYYIDQQDKGIFKICQSKTFALEGCQKYDKHIMISGEIILSGEAGKFLACLVDSKFQSLYTGKQLENTDKTYNIAPFQNGFIVLNFPYMYIWKKGSASYSQEKVIRINIDFFFKKHHKHLSSTKPYEDFAQKNLILSPQLDIVIFYGEKGLDRSIFYHNNFAKYLEGDFAIGEDYDIAQSQVNIKLDHSNSGAIIQDLKFRQITHRASQQLKVYSDKQSLFVTILKNQLCVYSSISYRENIRLSIQKLRELNPQIGKNGQSPTTNEQISGAVLHPMKPILIISLNNCLRVYRILYNELKYLKEIPISRCKRLMFNNSGSVLCAVVPGKQGAKVVLYCANGQEFEFIENLSIGKTIKSLIWSKYDEKVYLVHESGYFFWEVGDLFKIRNQSSIKFQASQALEKQSPKDKQRLSKVSGKSDKSQKKHNIITEKVKGALIGENDQLVVWSSTQIYRIKDNHQIMQKLTCKYELIEQIIFTHTNYIFILSNGIMCCGKDLNINAYVHKGFRITSRLTQYSLNEQSLGFEFIPLQSNRLLCLSQAGNILILSYGNYDKMGFDSNRIKAKDIELGNYQELVTIPKNNIEKLLTKHRVYEVQISRLQKSTRVEIDQLKEWFKVELHKKEEVFILQIEARESRIRTLKEEQSRLENNMESQANLQQSLSLKRVNSLQKLYQRKLALITNKLLTSQEVNYRDSIITQNNLKKLDVRHHQEIEEIRKIYENSISDKLYNSEETKKEILQLKKKYESKIYDLQQENQLLLTAYQDKAEQKISVLKKNVVAWEGKYGQCLSKNDNLQKQLDQDQFNIGILKQKLSHLETKKEQAIRRSEKLSGEVQRMEKIINDRNIQLQYLQQRVVDLEKSNEILKYRVIELKEDNDPKDTQIGNMKENLNDLQSDYDKLVKTSYDSEQKLSFLKKDNIKLKQDLADLDTKNKRVNKKYQQLIEKVRDVTKSPIQTIRKQLLTILDTIAMGQKNHSLLVKDSQDNPLGQLNRIRQHLQSTLGEVMSSNKKSEQHKRDQITRKNHQNSELLQEINQLRKKIINFEKEVNEKNREIANYKSQISNQRVRNNPSMSLKDRSKSQQRQECTVSKDFTRNKTRQTFYEKSMFKTYWKDKRLKTQQGSRRKKSSYSIARQNVYAPMVIEPSLDEVEHLRRVIEQKETIIKQLIHKVQNQT